MTSQVACKAALDPDQVRDFVNDEWAESVIPALSDYIRIPNKSPAFDPTWESNGEMARAVDLVEAWCRAHAPDGASVEVISEAGRTPLILVDVPGVGDDTVLLYGHIDKQPEMTGWSEGFGPWQPVIADDRLYGRGGADDGYAVFAAITAINALHRQGVAHARCVILIEACEESGSFDLPHYIAALADRLGTPSLIICLDSGCGNYDQLWLTTSLRGIIVGTLTVELISEGVHSGDATGIVAPGFRVIRQLLARLEDEDTGAIIPPAFSVDIPPDRVAENQTVAEVLAGGFLAQFPWHPGVAAASADVDELVLASTWRPGLEIIGADGLPPTADAGNVMRPITAVKLSLRLPPTAPAEELVGELGRLLEADPPYNAKVSFTGAEGGSGWNAPATTPWLAAALDRASHAYFGQQPVYMGEGGSIPFMAMLGERFPAAEFVITGVLGPHSNAHGPNEFLDLPTARRLTCCVASLLADHQVRQ